MHAKDVMSAPVLSVLPDTPVELAAKLLAGSGYATLPVVDAEDRLLGVITAAALPRKRSAPGHWAMVGDSASQGPHEPRVPRKPAKVASFTRTDMLATGPETQVSALARLMLEHQVHAVLIVEDGVLAGIVTRHDLLRVTACDDQIVAVDVWNHLCAAGRPGWDVRVEDGMVELRCDQANEIQRRVALVVAGSVPGVIGVRVVDPTFSTAESGDADRNQ